MAAPAPASPELLEKKLDAAQMMGRVQYLSRAIGARREGSERERRAARAIAGWLRGWGYRVRMEPVRLPDGSRSQNVVAEKSVAPGAKYFVLGAHYDSRDNTPGANDNASGVAALVEIARVLRDSPGVPVRFIAFGAEERWEARYSARAHRLNGSLQHVARLSASERARIRGMVSLDMVGVGDVLQIGTTAKASAGSTRLAQVLAGHARAIGTPVQRKPLPPWSDHVPFEGAGVPAVWMWWWRDPLFHTPRDTASRVRPEKVLAAARVALRAVAGAKA